MTKLSGFAIITSPQRMRRYRRSGEGASVAQLVEQRIRNAQVVGSSPTGSSMKNPRTAMVLGFWVLYGFVRKTGNVQESLTGLLGFSHNNTIDSSDSHCQTSFLRVYYS